MVLEYGDSRFVKMIPSMLMTVGTFAEHPPLGCFSVAVGVIKAVKEKEPSVTKMTAKKKWTLQLVLAQRHCCECLSGGGEGGARLFLDLYMLVSSTAEADCGLR